MSESQAYGEHLMCGLGCCWRTSPEVQLGLIVGQKTDVPVCICVLCFLCVCACFLHNLRACVSVCVCAQLPTWPKCIYYCCSASLSVSVPDPLVSVYVYLHIPRQVRVYIYASLYLFLCYISTLTSVAHRGLSESDSICIRLFLRVWICWGFFPSCYYNLKIRLCVCFVDLKWVINWVD